MKTAVTVVVAALVIIGLVAVYTYAFMFLWSIVAPVFGLHTLTFWQSLAMLALVGFFGAMFRGFSRPKRNDD